MGVCRKHYFMVGKKFDYDDFFDQFGQMDRDELMMGLREYEEDLCSEIVHKNGLCIVIDGMSGDYVYVGFVIKKSDVEGDFDDHVSDPEEVPTVDEVQRRVFEVFNIECTCDFHAFTHSY